MSDVEKLTAEEREYVERKTQRRKTLGGTMHLKGCKVRMTGDRRKSPWSRQKPITPAVTREQLIDRASDAWVRYRGPHDDGNWLAYMIDALLPLLSGATVAVDRGTIEVCKRCRMGDGDELGDRMGPAWKEGKMVNCPWPKYCPINDPVGYAPHPAVASGLLSTKGEG
jgi:hypothetical protein